MAESGNTTVKPKSEAEQLRQQLLRLIVRSEQQRKSASTVKTRYFL